MKLISLNIEGDKHLENRVLPFVQAERPDVVCFQEVFEVDVPRISQALGMGAFFAPTTNIVDLNPHLPPRGLFGVAQFTALPVTDRRESYYVGERAHPQRFFENENPNAQNRVLLSQTVIKDGHAFTVATTHFTWSPEGSYTEEQKHDFDALRNILVEFDELVLCGDTNSPRNGSPDNVFNTLARLYQDCIPAHYQTSVDSSLHKSGKQITLMVDGLFVTPQYQASEVRLVDGVSDHMAIVGEISRK